MSRPLTNRQSRGPGKPVDAGRKLDSNDARKVKTQRLESDHFAGLGADPILAVWLAAMSGRVRQLAT